MEGIIFYRIDAEGVTLNGGTTIWVAYGVHLGHTGSTSPQCGVFSKEAIQHMGYFFPQSEVVPLEEHVKILETAELLDFWEQSQFLEKYLDSEEVAPTSPAVVQYERVIIRELQFRSNMQEMEEPSPAKP